MRAHGCSGAACKPRRSATEARSRADASSTGRTGPITRESALIRHSRPRPRVSAVRTASKGASSTSIAVLTSSLPVAAASISSANPASCATMSRTCSSGRSVSVKRTKRLAQVRANQHFARVGPTAEVSGASITETDRELETVIRLFFHRQPIEIAVESALKGRPGERGAVERIERRRRRESEHVRTPQQEQALFEDPFPPTRRLSRTEEDSVQQLPARRHVSVSHQAPRLPDRAPTCRRRIRRGLHGLGIGVSSVGPSSLRFEAQRLAVGDLELVASERGRRGRGTVEAPRRNRPYGSGDRCGVRLATGRLPVASLRVGSPGSERKAGERIRARPVSSRIRKPGSWRTPRASRRRSGRSRGPVDGCVGGDVARSRTFPAVLKPALACPDGMWSRTFPALSKPALSCPHGLRRFGRSSSWWAFAKT